MCCFKLKSKGKIYYVQQCDPVLLYDRNLNVAYDSTGHTTHCRQFRTPSENISDVHAFDNQLVIDNLCKSLDLFEANGSGWKYDYVISFIISYAQYNPVGVVPPSPLQKLYWVRVFLILRMRMTLIALHIQY